MKKFLKVSLVLAMLVGIVYPVYAAWNLRQNADGTADFVRTQGSAEYVAPVGQVMLTAYMPDISTLSTVALAVPITNSELTYIQSVVHGNVTVADEKISFWHYRTGTNLGEISGGSRLTITSSGSATGDVDAITPAAASTNLNRLQRGDTIIIQTTGLSAAATGAHFTLHFDPR